MSDQTASRVKIETGKMRVVSVSSEASVMTSWSVMEERIRYNLILQLTGTRMTTLIKVIRRFGTCSVLCMAAPQPSDVSSIAAVGILYSPCVGQELMRTFIWPVIPFSMSKARIHLWMKNEFPVQTANIRMQIWD